jgi:aryl-alcohol dehydrogenase-like predicted oxidoreductase
MKRRDFIKGSVILPSVATLGQTMAGSAFAEEAGGKPKILAYRRLGRTNLQISDISYGAGKLPSAAMVLRAIDRGVNYFDTAPDYGRSEEYIGQAMKRFKARDKIHIASKFCEAGSYVRGKSHLQLGTDKATYKKAVEASLKRLNTDYLDVVFVHAIGERSDVAEERKRLLDDNMLSAFDELKQEGKARFLAVSSHGPNGMEELLMTAVESGHFDLIMPAFNFMKFPKVPEVIKAAHAKDVGVIAMKTLAGARDMSVDAQGTPFEQAAFKWVLSHPEVSGLVVTMKRVRDLDSYLPASGQTLSSADRRTLDRYAVRFGHDYCRTGCGDCQSACPHQVPIASILRYQMYFEQYADEKRAMAQYAELESNATPCLTCADHLCDSACLHGLPVSNKLLAAHESLTFIA